MTVEWRGRPIIILIATYLIEVFLGCYLYSFGYLHIELLQIYGEGDVITGLVGTLNTSFLSFIGPFASMFMNRLTARTSIVCGGLLISSGCLLSAFIPHIMGTIVCYGIVAGVGNSIAAIPLFIAPGYYFAKHREFVVTTIPIFPALGMFISTPVAAYLVDEYGVRGTYLIFSGCALHFCIAGLLFKPSLLEREIMQKHRAIVGEIKGDVEDFKRESEGQHLDNITNGQLQDSVTKGKQYEDVTNCQQLDKLKKGQQQDNVTTVQQPDNVTIFHQPDNVTKCQQPDNVTKCQQHDYVTKCQQPDNVTKCQQHDNVTKCQQPDNVTKCQQHDYVTKCQQPDNVTKCQQHDYVTKCQHHNNGTKCQKHDIVTKCQQHNNVTKCQQHDNVTKCQQPDNVTKCQQHDYVTKCQQPDNVTKCQQHDYVTRCQHHNNGTKWQKHDIVTKCQQHNNVTKCQQHDNVTKCQQHDNVTKCQQHHNVTKCQQQDNVTKCQQHDNVTKCQQHDNVTKCQQHHNVTKCQQQDNVTKCQQHDNVTKCQQHDNVTKCQPHHNVTKCQQQDNVTKCQQHDNVTKCQQHDNVTKCQQHDNVTKCQQHHNVTKCQQQDNVTKCQQTDDVTKKGQQHDKGIKKRQQYDKGINKRQQYKKATKCHPLLNCCFILFLVGTFAWNAAFGTVQLHLPIYLSSIGKQLNIETAMVLFGIGSVVGRLAIALISLKMWMQGLDVYILTLLILGGVLIAFPWYSGFSLASHSLAFVSGFATGAPQGVMPCVIMSILGIEWLSIGFDISYFFCGLGTFFGPNIASVMIDGCGCYEPMFIFTGSICLAGCVCSVLAKILLNRQQICTGLCRNRLFANDDKIQTKQTELNSSAHGIKVNDAFSPD